MIAGDEREECQIIAERDICRCSGRSENENHCWKIALIFFNRMKRPFIPSTRQPACLGLRKKLAVYIVDVLVVKFQISIE